MGNSTLDRLKSQSGVTLMELVVSLALVGILTVAFVSGNIFVQKIIGTWSRGNRLYEEGEWLLSELSDRTERCDSLRIDSTNSRWKFYSGIEKHIVSLTNGNLDENGKRMDNKDFTVKTLAISKIPFPIAPGDSILDKNRNLDAYGLYRIDIELQYRGSSHEFKTVVRNQKEFTNQTN